jgi:hypothetical protein
VSAERTLEGKQWRQLAAITVAAVAIFFGLRLLPTGTNLSHMDFRVDPRAGNSIEFCDPLNPQFIPVVAARSPVVLKLSTAEPATKDHAVHATLTLQTASGKPIAPEDLLVTHTERLHLLIVDPGLEDYQHVHPTPSRTRGEWTFSFTPQAAGAYRIFADFTPAATGRGLYASADLRVAGEAAPHAVVRLQLGGLQARSGTRFSLKTREPPLAGQPIDLSFAIEREEGAVALQPVMGAFAHLVAFDEQRTGFAHLHPVETDLTKLPNPQHTVLNFKLTIPRAGRYVVWAQVNLGGKETFVPFALEVR